MNEEIHIGKLIRKKLKESGRLVTWFAKEMGFHRTNAYKIFKKTHLHHSQLSRISKILDYNFHAYYSEQNKK